MNVSFVEKPGRGQIFDTEHDEIDAAIAEAADELNAAINAWYDYDAAHERHVRLRSRLESGRMPRYGNPLGVKVDSSGGGSNGAEDAMLNLVELGNKDAAARAAFLSAQKRVRDLIRSACRDSKTGQMDWRAVTALECRYLNFPQVSYLDMAKKHPNYFRTKSAAQWAATNAEAKVAEYLLTMRRTANALLAASVV